MLKTCEVSSHFNVASSLSANAKLGCSAKCKRERCVWTCYPAFKFAVSEVDGTSESIVKHNHYHAVDLFIDLLEKKTQILN